MQSLSPIDTSDDIARGLAYLSAADPRLDAVIAEAGEVPLRRSESGFASLASVIVSQQVSKQSAAAIWDRLVEASIAYEMIEWERLRS